MIVVAFHTEDSIYSWHAELLKRCLTKLNISFEISSIAQVEWNRAIDYKATFLLDARRKFSGQILYVDVDAIFHMDPSEYLSSIKEDIAVNFITPMKVKC